MFTALSEDNGLSLTHVGLCDGITGRHLGDSLSNLTGLFSLSSSQGHDLQL